MGGHGGGHGQTVRERWRGARRSIWLTSAAIMILPVAALVAVWGFAGAAVGDAFAHGGRASLHGTVLIEVVLAATIGLLAVLVAGLLLGRFARQITRDVASLEASARSFADQQLPGIIDRLHHGDAVDPLSAVQAPPRTRIAELSRVAAALDGVQRTAVISAAAEISVRRGISRVFVSLARRNQSLLQRQLRLIDDLEAKAADPGALADLFPLDHLTTRMRRHAEGLIILSGAVPGRAWSNPVPLIDVIRGAVAEVEDYQRVHVAAGTEGMMAGSAVADMIHLLAELIENATLFSPSGTKVEVRTERVGNGFTFEIEDRGLGIKPDNLDEINERLSNPTDFDMADADQLGLFVVSKLAARHGVRVILRPSPYAGTTAIVLIPENLVAQEAEKLAAVAALPGRAAAAQRAERLQLVPSGQPRRDQPAGSPRRRLLAPAPPLPAADAPGTETGPIPSIPRRRPTLPGRPDSVPVVDTHMGLPRRVRQANLSPHLREAAPRAEAASQARSPEQVRELLASLQSGWERGRQASQPGPATGASSQNSQPPQEGGS
jgi:signal transduction histidine kinase